MSQMAKLRPYGIKGFCQSISIGKLEVSILENIDHNLKAFTYTHKIYNYDLRKSPY